MLTYLEESRRSCRIPPPSISRTFLLPFCLVWLVVSRSNVGQPKLAHLSWPQCTTYCQKKPYQSRIHIQFALHSINYFGDSVPSTPGVRAPSLSLTSLIAYFLSEPECNTRQVRKRRRRKFFTDVNTGSNQSLPAATLSIFAQTESQSRLYFNDRRALDGIGGWKLSIIRNPGGASRAI